MTGQAQREVHFDEEGGGTFGGKFGNCDSERASSGAEAIHEKKNVGVASRGCRGGGKHILR